ncbi:MAG: DUF4129 domain-containing protein [Clostridiales bacterium]|nr:DUF4129 domain-containing protein [Clostridiales bacterium]
MIFEPTPPFAAILNDEPMSEINLGAGFDDPALDDYLDELDKYDDSGIHFPISGVENKNLSAKQIWTLIGIALGVYMLAGVSITIGRSLLFKNINGIKRFRFGYFEILRIAGYKGLKYKKGMTLMELATRIDNAYYMAHVSMKEITGTYYKIMYDGDDISEEDFRKMEVFYKEFRYEFNNELKLWEWILYRFLFPGI